MSFNIQDVVPSSKMVTTMDNLAAEESDLLTESISNLCDYWTTIYQMDTN